MRNITQNLIKLLCLSFLVMAVGCSEPKDKIAEPDQAAIGAGERIRELEDQLAMAERDRAVAEDEILKLRSEIDRLKDELAKSAQAGSAPGWNTVPGGAMTTIEGTVLFDSGKAALKSSAKGTLDAVVSVIKEKYPNHDIYVFGHTDNEPIKVSGWKDNFELSCQRALSVVRYLKGRGVSRHLSAAGWGEHRPVTDNKTTKDRQANRRVEIYAMEPAVGSVSAAEPASP